MARVISTVLSENSDLVDRVGVGFLASILARFGIGRILGIPVGIVPVPSGPST